MNDELLNIVDENNNVIGARPRNEVHQMGLRHRAVHILVFNRLNQLFLQKRSASKDINPGLWDTSAAGHVDAGEEYDNCAIRELQEELGVNCTDLEPLFNLPATLETGMEFIRVYRCTHEGPFTLAPDEIDQGQWFSIEKVTQQVAGNDPFLTQSFKLLWRHYTAKYQPD